MEIAFETRTLRRVCEERNFAIQKLGENVAAKLRHRLADLRAAESIYDIMAGNPRIINDGDASKIRINLTKNCFVLFCGNHVNNPRKNTDEIDWLRVRRIKILEIECDND